jgi:hypothetical protein
MSVHVRFALFYCLPEPTLSSFSFDAIKKCLLFKNVSSSHRMWLVGRGISNADILNLQNDALVAELFGTELNGIDVYLWLVLIPVYQWYPS